VTSKSESALRRAKRRLTAEAYKHLPSREVLQAATQLEQVKLQRQVQSEQLILQKASLAVAVLSQVPRDHEDNKPSFGTARLLLEGCLKHALEMLERGDEPDDEDDEFEDEDVEEETT
jgi:hypothetical protein